MAGEIFISYRRSDERYAKMLHDLLAARGVEAWYDRLVPAGEDWRSATANALVKAPVFVLLFSKNAAQSDDIIKELSAATFQKKVVIPVRIEDIHPEGAFLYELASRNWFDAFTDTDKRLAVLADQLAALVKGGAEAQAAASKLGAQTPLAPVRPRRMSPLFMGVLGLGALVVVAGALIALNPPKKPSAADNERTAFFGFTAAGSDPLVTEIATNATEETFSALGVLQIGTAARGDTQGVDLNGQLDKAAALDAGYALGGQVRASGGQISLNIRLDDVGTRATLWQETMTGDAAQRESLPVQAAAKASYLLECLIAVRPDMQREDATALSVVTRACGMFSGFDPRSYAAWRDVVRIAPKSLRAEYMTNSSWIYQAATAPAAERPAMLEQSRAALRRIEALDPNSPLVRGYLALADIASDRPLATLMDDLNAALAVDADRSNRATGTNISAIRAALLSLGGRNAEAVRLSRTDAATDPLNITVQSVYATALIGSGQILEARRLLDLVDRRMADPTFWTRHAIIETFSPGGNVAPLFNAIPQGASPETVACVQEAATAAPVRDTAIRKAAARRIAGCLRAGTMLQPSMGVMAIAGLGDTDTAFAVLDKILDRSNPLPFVQAGSALFLPQTKPLRADPRFLPLVKKVGIYQYWLDSKTQPDVCDTPEEREFEVCRELRKDQTK